MATFSKGVHFTKLEEQAEVHLSHGPTESPIRKRSLVAPSLIPNLTGFSQAVIPSGSSVERHVHPSKYETFFCLKGKGKFIVGRSEESCDEDVEVDLENYDPCLADQSLLTVAKQEVKRSLVLLHELRKQMYELKEGTLYKGNLELPEEEVLCIL